MIVQLETVILVNRYHDHYPGLVFYWKLLRYQTAVIDIATLLPFGELSERFGK